MILDHLRVAHQPPLCQIQCLGVQLVIADEEDSPAARGCIPRRGVVLEQQHRIERLPVLERGQVHLAFANAWNQWE